MFDFPNSELLEILVTKNELRMLRAIAHKRCGSSESATPESVASIVLQEALAYYDKLGKLHKEFLDKRSYYLVQEGALLDDKLDELIEGQLAKLEWPPDNPRQ